MKINAKENKIIYNNNNNKLGKNQTSLSNLMKLFSYFDFFFVHNSLLSLCIPLVSSLAFKFRPFPFHGEQQ